MNFLYLLYLISTLLVTVSCRIYSIENPDGSYTIGLNSDSSSQTANSLLALLSKSAGYTLNNNENIETPQESQHYQQPENKMDDLESRGILAPHLEILQLIETFLKFKGELGARISDLISDNYDMIRSVYSAVISKIGSLHTFTLTGIRILRKILEIASSFMAQWQVNVPGLSLDLNLGNSVGSNSGSSSSFSFNKNTNLFGRK